MLKIIDHFDRKDLNDTLLPGEKLENAMMWEDEVYNCHNREQVFNLKMENTFLYKNAPNETEGLAACLIGLVELVNERPINELAESRPLSLMDRINTVLGKKGEGSSVRYTNLNNEFVQKLYDLGMPKVLELYPEAAKK